MSSPALEYTAGTSCRAATRRRHVLLVDDNALQLKLVQTHLRGAGYSVTAVNGPSEALDAARDCHPDAIISDVVMDELDGFALCSVFRANPQFAHVPILLVTSHINSADERRIAISAGAEDLIERSPMFETGLETLADMLNRADDEVEWRPDPSVDRMAKQVSHLLEASRAAEARYRTIFESASDAVAVLTTDGIILESNHLWSEILQLPKERIQGRHIREFAAPGRGEENVAKYRAAIQQADSPIPLVPIARADGTIVYMEISNRIVTIGGETVVIAIGRDITSSLRARLDLMAAEQRYRTLIESIPDVVWSSTLDGRTTFISPNVARLCGFSAQEMLDAPGRIWFERIHPDDAARVRRAFAALVAARKSFDVDYRWQRKDGGWIWLHDRATVREGLDGVAFIDGIFSDVTEWKRLEDQLRLSQKMEAVGRLAGGIAHDFNNVLAVILANGEFLRDALPENDPRRADAEAIIDGGQRAAALIKQLLGFSRRQVVEPRVVNVNEIVGGIENMLRRVIGADVQLDCILAPDLGMVYANPGQLEQVIMNLVINARDAMPQGGRLRIETANVMMSPGGEVDAIDRPQVMLAVADTGCGMDEATKARIFEPFFTTKEIGKGTGLGLSTCYGIVRQSDGRIWVQSEPGVGSTFKVYLPRVEDAALPAGSCDAVR